LFANNFSVQIWLAQFPSLEYLHRNDRQDLDFEQMFQIISSLTQQLALLQCARAFLEMAKVLAPFFHCAEVKLTMATLSSNYDFVRQGVVFIQIKQIN